MAAPNSVGLSTRTKENKESVERQTTQSVVPGYTCMWGGREQTEGIWDSSDFTGLGGRVRVRLTLTLTPKRKSHQQTTKKMSQWLLIKRRKGWQSELTEHKYWLGHSDDGG